jgi:tRNA(Ile2) C34 agmatinyltransferase TiaS
MEKRTYSCPDCNEELLREGDDYYCPNCFMTFSKRDINHLESKTDYDYDYDDDERYY